MFQIEIPGAWNLKSDFASPKGVGVITEPFDQARGPEFTEGKGLIRKNKRDSLPRSLLLNHGKEVNASTARRTWIRFGLPDGGRDNG
jgi:hypothetical protein